MAHSVSSADDPADWFQEVLRASQLDRHSKPLKMVIAFSTSHFGTDPIHANSSRALASSLIRTALLPGDTVAVRNFEMSLWGDKSESILSEDPASILDAISTFPTAPKSGSRGGRDIERAVSEVLLDLSPNAFLIVLSPGPSQTPRGEANVALYGGDALASKLKARGFKKTSREFGVTGSAYRNILVTLVVPSQFGGGGRRGVRPKSWDQALTTTSSGSQQAFPPLWPYLLMAATGAGAGFLVGRRGASVRHEPTVTTAETLPEEGLNLAKTARSLDFLSQDMAESSQSLAEAIQKLKEFSQTSGQLRLELAEQTKLTEKWEAAAIDYLDGVFRATRLEGLHEAESRTWDKAGRDLRRILTQVGLDVIAPHSGETLQEGLHAIVDSLDGGTEVVEACLRLGYRSGSRIIRPAEVIARAKEN